MTGSRDDDDAVGNGEASSPDSTGRRDPTRRTLIAAIVGGTAAAGVIEPVAGYLRAFAPLSGSAWRTDSGTRTVSSPYGDATVRLDGDGVPHVEADEESAAAFAVGYEQATDRLFQIDLQRRVMRGRLSAVVGEATLESDAFHRRMGFVRAAEASWERVRDTDAGATVAAYADGVTARIEAGPLPPEFGLLGYEPDPWTPVDTMLMEKQIAWTLTGSFRSLRRALLRDRLGDGTVDTLFPRRYEHDATILRDTGSNSSRSTSTRRSSRTSPLRKTVDSGEADASTPVGNEALVSWLSGFESPPGIGSNSWIVSGEHTASGDALLANDPHLALQAPPLWYEQHVRSPGADVRGVTFPGVPFVVIGASESCSWGFTNPGSDQLDCYTYATRGERAVASGTGLAPVGESTVPTEYRYGDEWREFGFRTERIPVADGPDRVVPVRHTVHGPVLEREGQEVSIAWVGLAGSTVTAAIRGFASADDVDDIDDASRAFDGFSQCLVAADADGDTLFRVTGRVPIRRTDDEPIRGDRVHDGSEREGEWPGFDPYASDPDWSGTIPFEEMPARRNPDALGTANQRIIDDEAYPYYLSEGYSEPWRGIRLWDLLDSGVDDGDLDLEDMRRIQRDTVDGRAERFVPLVVAAVENASPAAVDEVTREAADALDDWDRRMERDSRAALLFDAFLETYREAVWGDGFADHDLDDTYWPSDWTLARLAPDDPWFDAAGERGRLLHRSLASAVEQIGESSAETYGDVNTTAAIRHPFDQAFLNYPSHPVDGSAGTLFNYRRRSAAGSSWRMVWSPASAAAILPGGNDGHPFSERYDDQLKRWADGEYKPLDLAVAGDDRRRFVGGGDE